MKNNRDVMLNLFGVLFLVWGLLSIYNSLFIFENPSQAIWFCYIGLILIGIGILNRNTTIILSQLYILFIPLIVWSMDFFYRIILNKPLFGITDYLFANQTMDLGSLLSLQHIVTIPLVIYLLRFMRIKKKGAEFISFIQIFLIYLFGIFFTNVNKNVNCVFEPCFELPFNLGQYYFIAWFISFTIMIYIAKKFIDFLVRRNFLKEA